MAIVLSFVYAWFCKHFAGLLVWLSVLLIALGGFFISYTLLTKAKEISDGSAQLNGNRVKTLRIMGYIVCIIASELYILLLLIRVQRLLPSRPSSSCSSSLCVSVSRSRCRL